MRTVRNRIRVITFQSHEVTAELKQNGLYYANNYLSRERNDYSADIEALGGYHPVWVFQIPNDINLNLVDWYRGRLFNLYKCEMSIEEEDFMKLDMLEFEVDEDLALTGITHNSYSLSKVLPHLKLDWLVMHYKMSERFSLDDNQCPNSNLILTYAEDIRNETIPYFEDRFHVLTGQEWRSLKDTIPATLPLKAFEFKGAVDRDLARNYLDGLISKTEFYHKSGVILD